MDRFWEKVEKTDYCWNWTGGKDDFGYGLFRYDGTIRRAHRVSYLFAHDRWPTFTRHSCDNPSCVNPEHLLEGTHQDNVNDMIERSRHNWPLTDEQVKQIRAMEYDNTIVSRVCKGFDVTEAVAKAALSGTGYKHLPGGKRIPRQKSKRILSDAEVDEIETALQEKYWGQQLDLAAKYGVSRFVIQQISYGTYDVSRNANKESSNASV